MDKPLFRRKEAYDVVIRVHQRPDLLERAIDSLNAQTIQPTNVIVVDNSQDAAILRVCNSRGCCHLRYPDEQFNYSKALNLGAKMVREQYTLILSSHVELDDFCIAERLLTILSEEPALAAAYCTLWHGNKEEFSRRTGKISTAIIRLETFTGFNGTHNVSCMYRTKLLLDYPFRIEVFSAEDMEWTQRILKLGYHIARFEGLRVMSHNPNRRHLQKWANEVVAILAFVKPELNSFARIVYYCLKGVGYLILLQFRKGACYLNLAYRLVMLKFGRVYGKSRYFG